MPLSLVTSNGASTIHYRMTIQRPTIPKKYQPRGFEIIHEDKDLIVGIKSAGVLTVAAKWEKNQTVHNALNQYVRKGSSISKKSVYVVHRLDQATTGLLVFAKSEDAQLYLKAHWSAFEKHYVAIVEGKMPQKKGLIQSYLEEDDEYIVHSTSTSSTGKLAKTEYEVLAEAGKYSLVCIRLLTGRKNQIRVHMADQGCPIVGDDKYGSGPKGKPMALHSYSLEINHPFHEKRLRFFAEPPAFFKGLVPFDYSSL